MNKNTELLYRIVSYIGETWKNKLYAIVLMTFGYLTIRISNEGTGALFLAIFAIPLFFSKKNWVS